MASIFTININPKATQETISRAFAKAEAQRDNYDVTSLGTDHNGNTVFMLRNIQTGARYVVETKEIFSEAIVCNCPACKADHFCKHCARGMEEIDLWRQEAEFDPIDACGKD